LIALSVILLLGSAVPAAGIGTREHPTVAISAISHSHGSVAYALVATNGTQAAFGGLTVSLMAPGGAIDEVLTHPLAAETHQGPSPGSVSWELKSLPARSIVGPFAVRVSYHGKPAPARAVLRWTLPAAGELKIASTGIEDATEAERTALLKASDLTKARGTGFAYSLGPGPLYHAPLGGPGLPTGSRWTGFARTGVRGFVPVGDLGLVAVSRLDEDPPHGTGSPSLAWVGTFYITKEHSGAAIFEVPLRLPAPPYALVRVFGDDPASLREEATLGTVSADGLHAVFAADGTGTYALGVDGGQLTAGVVDLGPAGWARKGIDPTAGVSSLFQESYSEVVGITQMAESFLGLLTGMTSSHDGVSQGPIDTDGDGLSDFMEERVTQTRANDPDTDDDGRSDGDEFYEDGTDPHNPDTDDDGVTDGDEHTLGTDPHDDDTDNDGFTDGDEVAVGTDPLDDDSDDDGTADGDDEEPFAPIPGCGGWGTCFSTDGGATLAYLDDIALTPALEGVLSLPEGSSAILPRGTAAGLGTELEGGDLRSIFGIAGGALFVVVPAGQRVGVTLDRPLLADPRPDP
jgi:hypothetical protein